ncbi:MAG: cation transporter [Oligoflexia bacterium]|nr:cation transporter [Oligoflexia bacterium]
METITLKVEGMTCMGCVNNVKKILQPLAGVRTIDISLDQGNVTVAYESGQTRVEDLKAAIESAGYDVVG